MEREGEKYELGIESLRGANNFQKAHSNSSSSSSRSINRIVYVMTKSVSRGTNGILFNKWIQSIVC